MLIYIKFYDLKDPEIWLATPVEIRRPVDGLCAKIIIGFLTSYFNLKNSKFNNNIISFPKHLNVAFVEKHLAEKTRCQPDFVIFLIVKLNIN